MTIAHIHSFLVHPASGEDSAPASSGSPVPLSGKLFDMLRDLFDGADRARDIGIVFRTEPGKPQSNPCRELFLSYLHKPSMKPAKAIADRLQLASTHRSGLGLLFLVAGDEGQKKKLLVARFPADSGIIAEEKSTRLNLTFMERVFMKNAHAYKSASFITPDLTGGMWEGVAVDRQIDGPRELSQYWIDSFLGSDLRSTPMAGTKRLAVALRQATASTHNASVRTELIAVSQLLPSSNGRRISPESLCQNMNLSPAAAAALREALPRPELFFDKFEFVTEEYQLHIHYRAVELDNGARMIAENARFDDIFISEPSAVAEGSVRYVTQGKVVSQRLRKDV
jgi:hypothetical protein